ncbi:MAG: hypothetical protein ACOH5I_26300 [Oligoflexus sp.]
MRFLGLIEKHGTEKYWGIGIDELSIYTQGISREDAFLMLEDAICLLAEDFSQERCEIEFEDTGGNEFYLSIKNHDVKSLFIQSRLKIASRNNG